MSKSTKQTCPVTVETLKRNYDIARTNYTKIHTKMRILDAVDRGRLWQGINAKFPRWQIQPDTNWISYIKSNIVASIYTVTKGATLIPTSDDDREVVEHINTALDYIWDISKVGYYELQAGNDAALFNLGITQVGWNADAQGGTGDTYYKGDLILKNVHPLHYMRDPFASSLKDAAYVFTYENLHKTVILGDPRYHDSFQSYLDHKRAQEAMATAIPDPVLPLRDVDNTAVGTDDNYYKVFVHYVKYNAADGSIKICEVHTLNNDMILWFNDEIKPNCFPFAELFCNLPDGDVVGTSECARVLSNNIAYNMINSMLLTGIYKNYHPAKFISSASGLNIATFTKHGHEPDRTYVVNGDASRAVHYGAEVQPTAADLSAQAILAGDIQKTSGIDERYTGRDTGSVLTTGGVEDMLERVTIADTPKIRNYEQYVQDLTHLILANFVEFSMKRTYFKKNVMENTFEKFEVDYKAISKDTIFHYSVNISSELPKNKQRLASMANTLMEKQMQYGANMQGQPDLITPEEWLQMQDLPNREFMQKRMGVQRISNETTKFAGGLFDYAALINNGTSPEDALGMVGENMAAQNTGGQAPNPIPDLDTLIPNENGVQPTEQTLDPMQMLQQNPDALLQTPSQTTPVPQTQDVDPNIFAALGNI